jgi:N6-adenosine-specific RNA methylase IME4
VSRRLNTAISSVSQADPGGSLLDAIPVGRKFGAILADPPFAFATYSAKGEGRSPQRHYRCEPIAELYKLPVADFAADDCYLFVWVPPPHTPLVEPLLEAWGFAFSGLAFTWVKTNKNGGWFMGCGYTTRHNAEFCWLGRRGKPKRKSRSVRELIVAPRREHSRKCDDVHRRIEALAEGPYLELFARTRRASWTCVGDEVGRFAP